MNMFRLAAVTGLIFASGLSQSSIAKQANPNASLEIRPVEEVATQKQGNASISTQSGFPRALYRLSYDVTPDTPENMARQYLQENAALLGLKPDLSDLVYVGTRETPGGLRVRFTQSMDAIPVQNSGIVVSLNHQNQVVFLMSDYKHVAAGKALDPNPSVSKSGASQIAKGHLTATGRIHYEATETVVIVDGGNPRLMQKVTVVPAETVFGDWEILVDAHSGTIYKATDNACYLDGTGDVFDPDPLTNSQEMYGTGGFVDNGDSDSSDLNDQRDNVTLNDLSQQSGQFFLQGPYASIVDIEAPFTGLFDQATDSFSNTRSASGFEAVNVYHHIDTAMRYINETLGFSVTPFQYTGGVRFDPHGLNGSDNSHYLGSTGEVTFGEGGVDDAEDLGVIWHELGHGLHDWVTDGNLSQVDGLSEGSGDYWAASYLRSHDIWDTEDPQYHWVFLWDGHNEFWGGRATNHDVPYPGGLIGQIHTDGQIWSTTLMQIYDKIGRTATDKNFLEALSMTGSTASQNDAAEAFIQADLNLYAGVHLDDIIPIFVARGYDVSVPVAPVPTVSEWGMIALGLLVVGIGIQRIRRSHAAA